ncbi:OpgC domain-containing protein [Gordonia sp. NB41Y]|uniref:OpgC domain-containing protein n=1 Tax=Gordonia sp. NB41Y TaxID=875808 RepID=UPI0009E93288|nr:OpgC domain-containing protein [Gordonia sp. NB41Y]WLP91360.1 OpgC domain-containing protein [Gordonia sp. NB41Y]
MNRDLAIDATRGLAIWSMITAHFATGAAIDSPTHAFPYVDGMSAFVLLSGFVLGLVYHRWIDRHGLRFAYRRLTRRLVVLYLCQVLLAVVAVAAALAGHRWLTLLLPVDGWGDGLLRSLTLTYLPSGGNILLMYMVFMASAFVLFPVLMRGGWWLILVASLALYVVSQTAAPDWFYLTADMAGPRIQNWAGWQIMFVPAVVIGWNWRRWDVAARIDRLLPLLVALALGVALSFHLLIEDGPLTPHLVTLADKLEFGPARALGAWVLVPVVYGVFRLVLRFCHHDWLRPLVMTGTRSLDSYVIQAIALIVVPIHVAHRPWSPLTMSAVAVTVFACCWAWAEFRRACEIDKLHRLPVIVVDAALPGRRHSPADAAATPDSPSTPDPRSTADIAATVTIAAADPAADPAGEHRGHPCLESRPAETPSADDLPVGVPR